MECQYTWSSLQNGKASGGAVGNADSLTEALEIARSEF
jgi:hypothetical protein